VKPDTSRAAECFEFSLALAKDGDLIAAIRVARDGVRELERVRAAEIDEQHAPLRDCGEG
jgi:hypothetical protein